MTHLPEFGTDQRDEEVGATAHTSQSHHEKLWTALVDHSDGLTAAADAGEDDRRARGSLVRFLRDDVMAHLQAEAEIVYHQARSIGAEQLVTSLEMDHAFILDLVEEIEQAATASEASRCTRAMMVLIALRVRKEEEIVLPALREAGIDVDALLAGMITGMATDYDARFSYL